MVASHNRTAKLRRELIETIAQELGGGEYWFYEYPNSDWDRERFREKAAKLLDKAQSKLKEHDNQTVMEYGMKIILDETE